MYNEKILLIDLSYCCFYRFYSTKKWYGLSHPEVDLKSTENWKEIPEFLDKFSKMFLNAISNLKKKYNIKWDNIIIIKDCHRKDIWRMDLFKDLKALVKLCTKNKVSMEESCLNTHMILLFLNGLKIII